MIVRTFCISVIILFGIVSTSFAAESNYCTPENYSLFSKLYENKTPDTARMIFHVLDCGGNLSKKTRKAQYVALVGGFMRVSPDLVNDVYLSAQKVNNLDAPKIFLDALWLCASDACREKLKSRPFSLPEKDITVLLQETPPDPYSLVIAKPESIDFLWGYFGGTGDTRVVQRIFDFVRSNWKSYDSTEQIGAERRMLIESAKWSLLSMAAQNKLVKSVLEAERSSSQVASKLLEEVEKRR